MVKTTFTLKTIDENEKLHLSVSFLVYSRMIKYLRMHKCVFNVITTEEYMGKGVEEEMLTVLNRNVTLQFESSKAYYKMVEELVYFMDKTNINKN